MPAPTVSIGVPTFERGEQLDVAVASALAQTHAALTVLISDNASGDDTAERCAAWARVDSRVSVVRHAENLGPTANFNGIFARLDGPFTLLLSDDDHLEPEYVARCVDALSRDPGLIAVAGTARYVRASEPVREGRATQLPQASARERILAYYRAPDDGPFYGVVRSEALRAAGPMPNVLANDWLHVGRLAAVGRIAMLDTTHLVRELGGTSASVDGILKTFGARSFGARIPHLLMAWAVFADVGWRAPAHAAVGGTVSRLAVATSCALGVIDWPSLAWHLTAPTMHGLNRRPRGRPIAGAYDRLTRVLGASRPRT